MNFHPWLPILKSRISLLLCDILSIGLSGCGSRSKPISISELLTSMEFGWAAETHVRMSQRAISNKFRGQYHSTSLVPNLCSTRFERWTLVFMPIIVPMSAIPTERTLFQMSDMTSLHWILYCKKLCCPFLVTDLYELS